MTVSERRNYQVAVLFSIILHLSLMLIVFPAQLLLIPAGVEEVAVEIYELVDSQPGAPAVGPEPELVVKPEISKPNPTPSRTKPVVQSNPQPKTGQSNQISKSTENLPKAPISFGDGVGMVVGFGQAPYYPKNADNEGVEGEAIVRILIKKNGTLEQSNLIKSSGDSRLDQAAVNSIKRQWTFKPNTEDYYIDIMFSFVDSHVEYKLINSATRP